MKQLRLWEIQRYKKTKRLLLVPQLFTVNICHLTDIVFDIVSFVMQILLFFPHCRTNAEPKELHRTP